MTRPFGLALVGTLALAPLQAGAVKPAATTEAAETVQAAGVPAGPTPSLGGVKAVVKGAAQEALGKVTGAGQPTPAIAVAPTPAPTDLAGRAALLRKKTLRDDDFVDADDRNRDPFRSYVRMFTAKEGPKTPKVPAIFDKFSLEELTLIGIVSGDANPRAMFRDPGGLGQTLKRGGKVNFVSLDDDTAENRYLLEPATDLTPERLYERRWVQVLLEQVLARLREQFAADGKEDLFDHLKVFLTDVKGTVSSADAAAELDMSEDAVKQAVRRLRGRYRELLRREIAHTVSTPAEVEDEIRHLFELFER